MKTKKKKYDRPWLTPTRVEIPTVELREIAKSWQATTWEAYLKWYEVGNRERLIQPAIYDQICDLRFESIFVQFNQDSSPENRAKCDRLLALLPPLEAVVLRQVFIEGRTEVEIAYALRRSQTGINLIKNRALSCLKWGNSGDGMFARQFMRGENSFSQTEESSIWDEKLSFPLKEPRVYSPKNYKAEIAATKTSCVRVAIQALPELAQEIIYLRYWCGHSINEIARITHRGVNVVEQIESASISKIKRSALEFELGTNFGGGQWN